MKKHLWLDLEDTIIEPVMNGWANAAPINIQKVKSFIGAYKPDFVHIFSFAIHNDFEKRAFTAMKMPTLEKLLGIKFDIVPTVNCDIIPACAVPLMIAPSTVGFSDLITWWGKQQAFRLFLMNQYKNNKEQVEAVLLDDDVTDEHFTWPDQMLTGRILNIDKLKVE